MQLFRKVRNNDEILTGDKYGNNNLHWRSYLYFNYSYFNCSRTSIVAQREFTIEMIGNRLRSGITPGTESRGAQPSTWGTFASWDKVVVFWYIVFPTERTTRFKAWSECNDLTFISFKLVKLSQVMALLNGFLFRKG